jgi:hypothetical protein
MIGRLVCAAWLGGVASPAFAQHETHTAEPPARGWAWRWDAQAFLNANLQERKFRDVHVIESQNWLMVSGIHAAGRARLRIDGMFSAEPFTLHRYGSPQVFQVGETFEGASLLDYQHPHDLVMGATARIDLPIGARWRARVEGGPVGSPALGPEPFMHRASAAANPTAPLAHHHLDATHITHGVVTAAIVGGPFAVEASAFHGREPDDRRVAIAFGPIDSYAARGSWRTGRWHAQVSAGHLKFPDPTEFTDVDRLTASIAFTSGAGRRGVAWLAAFGLNREPALDVTLPAWLFEATVHMRPQDLAYTRVEWLEQDILTRGGYDPPGFAHPHITSRIGALTVGYERTLSERIGHVGVGADVTVHARDENLDDSYGRPWGMHFFLRWKFRE